MMQTQNGSKYDGALYYNNMNYNSAKKKILKYNII